MKARIMKLITFLKKRVVPALLATLVLAVITGLLYPAVVTGIAQLAFPHQANGSQIYENGTLVGSELIGQKFTQDKYFHGRPSAAGSGYDATFSGGSNLAPSNPILIQRLNQSINDSRISGDKNKDGTIPVDSVTASGSGLDPDITLANALDQAPRVAKARNISEDNLRGLIERYTEGRDLGVLGEPSVNVLRLNLALDRGESGSAASAANLDQGNPQIFGTIQIIAVFVVLIICSYVFGTYLYKIITGRPTNLSRRLDKIESLLYRLLRIEPTEEMNWRSYAICVLAFSFISIFFTYVILRMQGILPLNPDGLPGVSPDVALNTAISFGANTNWQVYSGERTMSYLSQMLALTFQNFISTAVGLAVAVALIRGMTRRTPGKGLGNFWVDLTRITLYVLIPVCIIAAIFFVSQGVPQTFSGAMHATTLEGAQQTIPVGPVASQEAIKEFGTNGGGFFNANSAHPFENPTPLSNVVEIILILLLPGATIVMFGLMAHKLREGWVLFIVVLIFLAAAVCFTTVQEQAGNRSFGQLGVDQAPSGLQSGGNMEGKEVRFGIYGSTVFAVATTSTSCGAVNSMHDSYTPLGGAVPMVLILVGEVVPGGVGSGFFTLIIYALITIFIAGLMVGRIPNYLGKKVETFDMKMCVLVLIILETTVLTFSAIAISTPDGLAGITNPGPHGLSQILYAYGSGVGNNGSAFGGLNAALPWYMMTMVVAMFIGRFLVIIPVLAIAGNFSEKHVYPPTAGTMPTDNPTFGGFLLGVIVIVAGLSFLPILVLGPILEHLLMLIGSVPL